MALFSVIETDAGLMVTELDPGARPDEAALKHGGVVVDPGPYRSFEEAYDAALAIQYEEDDEDSA